MNRQNPRRRPLRQRGVVLLFALIALLILLIGAVALVRSFNTSLFMAGNIGFKRDLQNRNDAVTTIAINALSTGSLKDRTTRKSNQPSLNYSASLLSVDKQGIPDVLTRNDRTDRQPGAFRPTGGDLTIGADGDGVTVAYVIDRLCATTGDEKVLGPSQCATVKTVAPGAGLPQGRNSDTSGSLASGTLSSAPIYVLYRLSARITGPRNTVSFFQSTIAVAS